MTPVPEQSDRPEQPPQPPQAPSGPAPVGMSVVAYVADLDRVTAFYAGVLGVEPERPEETYAVLGGAGWQLVLQAIPRHLLPAAGAAPADPPSAREDTPVKAVLPVASLAHLARARDLAPGLGGRLLGPEREWTFRGSVRCDGVDPEGTVFQLAAPPD